MPWPNMARLSHEELIAPWLGADGPGWGRMVRLRADGPG
jgi:hypothetical protein